MPRQVGLLISAMAFLGTSARKLLPVPAAGDAISLPTKRTGGRGGLIILDRQGRPGFAFSTPAMAYAYRTTSPVTASGIFDSEL